MTRASGQGEPTRLSRFARRFFFCALLSAFPVFCALPWATAQGEKEPIKVGILHSLTGTMAISETSLKDVELMAIEEINEAGGVLGKKIEAVVEDPESKFTDVFPEKAKKLLLQGQGRRRLRLLDLGQPQERAAGLRGEQRPAFYPVQYEGNECSKNVVYTGAAPNQQILPAVDWLLEQGGRREEEVLPARLRLRLPADGQPDHRQVPQVQGA